MTSAHGVVKKRSAVVVSIVLLLLAAAIIVCSLMFISNYLIFTSDGIRFDFSGSQPITTKALHVVVQQESPTMETFLPTAVPSVHIEDTALPPK